jgi:hypothetical protein
MKLCRALRTAKRREVPVEASSAEHARLPLPEQVIEDLARILGEVQQFHSDTDVMVQTDSLYDVRALRTVHAIDKHCVYAASARYAYGILRGYGPRSDGELAARVMHGFSSDCFFGSEWLTLRLALERERIEQQSESANLFGNWYRRRESKPKNVFFLK